MLYKFDNDYCQKVSGGLRVHTHAEKVLGTSWKDNRKMFLSQANKNCIGLIKIALNQEKPPSTVGRNKSLSPKRTRVKVSPSSRQSRGEEVRGYDVIFCRYESSIRTQRNAIRKGSQRCGVSDKVLPTKKFRSTSKAGIIG